MVPNSIILQAIQNKRNYVIKGDGWAFPSWAAFMISPPVIRGTQKKFFFFFYII